MHLLGLVYHCRNNKAGGTGGTKRSEASSQKGMRTTWKRRNTWQVMKGLYGDCWAVRGEAK